VLDTKLSKKEKTSHVIQLCFYSELLAEIQGVFPKVAYIVDGHNREISYSLHEYYAYYTNLKRDFLNTLHTDSAPQISPEPCHKCNTCHWIEHCKEHWQERDHLSLVARITSSQRNKLVEAKIATVADLVVAPEENPSKLHPRLYKRLKTQASLQRSEIQPRYEFIDPADGGTGFTLLPPPSPGDLFYDIEADPLIKANALAESRFNLRDGLEYLHGISYRNPNGAFEFSYFFAENKSEERQAFESLIDLFEERCKNDPNAHIYHYSPYERAALRRLAAQYPTRTEQLDQLYREERFVDLYAVVRNSIQVSEPRYSIKNLEIFYSKKRTQEVKGGGESIVVFEKYLKTRDPKLKQDIIEYNRKDCDSTIELFDWLHTLKKEAAKKFNLDWDAFAARRIQEETEEQLAKRATYRAEAEERTARYEELFNVRALEQKTDAELTQLEDLQLKLYYLADFYRQEDKPAWWEFFNLKNDREARALSNTTITQCIRDHETPDTRHKNSKVVHYKFDPRAAGETKISVGDSVYDLENDQDFGTILELDTTKGTAAIKLKGKATEYETVDLALAPKTITGALTESIDRFLTHVGELNLTPSQLEKRSYPYSPLIDILLKANPTFKTQVKSIVTSPSHQPEFTTELLKAALNLDNSYLFMQGPPGTGKTYHGAKLALGLMRHGMSVGLTSNSHKAINNFLRELDEQAVASGNNQVKATKKAEQANPQTHYEPSPDNPDSRVTNVWKNNQLEITPGALIAGTPWAFVAPEFDQALDYLIVDEASQLSIAHLVASGVSAKNIILIGDPRQLPQPLQGQHLAELDKSPLELLLGDDAVVPPHRGVFLETSRRMHTEICGVLSKHVYDNKLQAPPENARHAIHNPNPQLITKNAGLLYLAVEHTRRVSVAPEEITMISKLVDELRHCSFESSKGEVTPLTPSDIMIVAPYNLQVRALKEAIPDVRIGTIDLFQGQQAPVTILSMTTSDVNEAPRGIEFLFSTNRVNVALSRAQALAIVVASPELLRARCRTPEQMRLVNFFCAVAS
jgi:uncharacterized protein